MLDDPCQKVAQARRGNWGWLNDALDERISQLSVGEFMRLVDEKGRCGGFVNKMSEVQKDPRVIHNGTFVTDKDKVLGLIRENRPPVRYSVTEEPFPGCHVPEPGDHLGKKS